MDKFRKNRKISRPTKVQPPTKAQPTTASNEAPAAAASSTSAPTKFTITIQQKVPSGTATKKGPYSVGTVDPNEVFIKRRIGEGAKPLFSRDELRAKRSASPKAKRASSSSSSYSRSSSPDPRRQSTKDTSKPHSSKTKTPEKIPYFFDQKREKEMGSLPINGSKRILIKRITDHDKMQGERETHSCSNELLTQGTESADHVEENRNVTTISESGTATDEELRAREWALIKRERELFEKERMVFTKEREIVEKLRQLRQPVADRPKINCNIREIADLMPIFSPGTLSSISAECWVSRVESLAKLYEWDERALLMAAASKMQGAARYWWDTAEGIFTSWLELSNGLKENFPEQLSEVDIHQQLAKKTRKTTETIENYCFEMNMLGKKIKLSDKTIIQYILTGLNDPLMSSSLAAGSFRDIAELIEKIKWFDSIRCNLRQGSANNNIRSTNNNRSNFSVTGMGQIKLQPINMESRISNKVVCYNCH